jgi:hypothetical protein
VACAATEAQGIGPNTKKKGTAAMDNLLAVARNIVMAEIFAILMLLVAGAILTWTEDGQGYTETFFTYRIEHLDFLPAWFACLLLLMVINGVWMFRLANIEGFFRTPPGGGWGEWSLSMPINPLRLVGINLIAVPVALALFLIARANYW